MALSLCRVRVEPRVWHHGRGHPVPYTGSIADVVDDGTFVVENGGSSLDVTSAVDPSSSGYFLLTSQSTLEIAACLGTDLKI